MYAGTPSGPGREKYGSTPRNSAYQAAAAGTSSAQMLRVANPRRLIGAVLTFGWCCSRRYRLLWNVWFLNACETEEMLDTSVRLLRLLSLLQSAGTGREPSWPSAWR